MKNKTLKQYERNLKRNQKKYVRVTNTSFGMEVQVWVPTWKNSYEIMPDDNDWHVYKRLGFECDGENIIKTVERASISPRFFFTCSVCSDVKNNFFLTQDNICADCAPEDPDIVY